MSIITTAGLVSAFGRVLGAEERERRDQSQQQQFCRSNQRHAFDSANLW
jgi:hypothetical protein